MRPTSPARLIRIVTFASIAIASGWLLGGCGAASDDDTDEAPSITASGPASTTPATAPASTDSTDSAAGESDIADSEGTEESDPETAARDLDYAYELLDALPTRGFVDGPPYDRADYLGASWPDTDGDCLDDRDEALVQDAEGDVTFSPDGCHVRTGRWIDPYEGIIIDDPRDTSIDHVVALAEAHWAGGHAWSPERRRAYATDLGDTDTLWVTTEEINQDKRADPPEAWMPGAPEADCQYAIARIRVMTRWGLAVRDSDRHPERATLEAALNLCPADTRVAEVTVVPGG